MKKISVGIADDNEISLEILKMITEEAEELELVGAASNGPEALELIWEERPDVMLLDIIMPTVDGLDVLAITKQNADIHTKFIMVSAIGDEKITADAFAMGADYYIMKPFHAEMVLRDIKRIMKKPERTTTAQRIFENPQCDEERHLNRRITRMLLAVGIPAQLNGYQYLRDAIHMTVEDTENISAVTKTLYPMLAEKYHVTTGSVERAIRHAIETSWKRGSVETIDKVFGYTIADGKGKPTNSEFIAMIADHIRMGYQI